MHARQFLVTEAFLAMVNAEYFFLPTPPQHTQNTKYEVRERRKEALKLLLVRLATFRSYFKILDPRSYPTHTLGHTLLNLDTREASSRIPHCRPVRRAFHDT